MADSGRWLRSFWKPMARPSQDQCESKPALLQVDTAVPLCVDLDGSLIKSDSLWEGFWSAARRRPFQCLRAAFSLRAGRAKFKRRIADLALTDFNELPYRHDV